MTETKKYLIVEDEYFAYEEAKRIISHLRPQYQLMHWTESVAETVEYLSHETPDFIIMDIQLSDGLSLDIFHRIECRVPVIFTTAFDEYAIQAFKTSGIDYLLKPIDEEEMLASLEKMERLAQPVQPALIEQQLARHYTKNRFLLQIGDEYRYVPTSEIACFWSEDKANYVITRNGRRYVIDYSLDMLEEMVAHNEFCRISRGCIANISAVTKCYKLFAGKLGINLLPDCPQGIVVSRSRAENVLKWMDGYES
ncbi:MAG: LytTR family DNA-binding domain-containing protein [Bacteroidales bacterium]|nr:LytTR family DNA-binding domain-containing protein [Bacteroidales bacterium]